MPEALGTLDKDAVQALFRGIAIDCHPGNLDAGSALRTSILPGNQFKVSSAENRSF